MEFVEILKVILFGIIEGITEWLPISSTGHLILLDEFVKLNLSEAFMNMFNVVIQLGAIMAVVVLYFPKLWPFSTKERYYCKKDTWSMWFKVIVATIPTIIIGLPFDDFLDEHLHTPVIIATMLIIYGVLFIIVERKNAGKLTKVNSIAELTYQMAFFIGAFQVLSLIPGTSRSGATIIGAMLIGASRFVATEFTFFLAIPAMFGASLLKVIKFGFVFSQAEIMALLIGMITAFIVSIIVIRFLMGYIKKHNFVVFGWYRIILGILVLGYFFIK